MLNSQKNINELWKIAFIALLLTLLVCVSLLGCTKNSNTEKNQNLNIDNSQLELTTNGQLTVATTFGYPPFVDIEDGVLKGTDIEFANLIAKDLGLKPNIQAYHYLTLYETAKANKNYDLIMCGLEKTDDRNEIAEISDPYFSIDMEMVFYARADSNITEDNFDEVIAKQNPKISVVEVSSFRSHYLEQHPNANILPTREHIEIAKALDSKDSDLALSDYSLLDIVDNKDKYKIVKTIPVTEYMVIGIAKNKLHLKDAINEIIKAKKEDGTLDRMYKEYIGS